MRITIVGLGLIGGSMALDLRKRQFADHLIGVDSNTGNAEKALELKLVDELLPLEKAIPKSDLIILAIPVLSARMSIIKILDNIEDHTVVMDVGSTKAGICAEVENHTARSNFAASHPMAGTEFFGPEAAIHNLFDGKAAIICNKEQSDSAALKTVEALYTCLGMHLIYMDATSHDVHAAYVSHISHISSFVLSLTVLEKEKSEKTILEMASGGFESTVRLAKSSKDMWSQIFIQNKVPLIEVVDKYMEYLDQFKKAIMAEDIEGIKALIIKANKIEKALKKNGK